MSIEVSIRKKYSGFTLNMEFQNENKNLGILGASGSGKSLSLKCIAGVEKPDSGSIIINGRVLFDSEKGINLSPQQRKVGYLFQNYALFPTMTVEENIGVAIKATKDVKRQIIAEKIQNFRLEGLEKRYPSELSGGQQQRVAIARMLACNPEVILLDEPFSALDSYLKEIMQQQLIDTLKEYQGDVILVSHNRDEIYRLCEKLMIVNNGNMVIVGDTISIFENPQKLEAAKLTGCKNISSIQKIDEYTIKAVNWGVKLKLKKPIDDKFRYVGIRAHDSIPMWEDMECNRIPFELSGIGSLPFEEHFFIKAPNSINGEEPFCWFVYKDKLEELNKKGYPLYLCLPEEKIMLLE